MLDLVGDGALEQGVEVGVGEEGEGGAAVELPDLEVGVEDAVAEDVEDLVELGAFGVVGEVAAEDVVNVGGIGGEEHVHVAEQGAFPLESAAGLGCQLSCVVVESVDVEDETRDHSHHRPVGGQRRGSPVTSF